jgi:hypothetical protein
MRHDAASGQKLSSLKLCGIRGGQLQIGGFESDRVEAHIAGHRQRARNCTLAARDRCRSQCLFTNSEVRRVTIDAYTFSDLAFPKDIVRP